MLKKYLKANKCQKIAQNKLFKTRKIDISKGQKGQNYFLELDLPKEINTMTVDLE